MRNIILIMISMIICGGQAHAEDCPDFFRFVDFGIETPSGTTRGGPTYRAESFDGQALLIRRLTLCRDVQNLAADGRGNPIPVVTSINYNPEMTGIDLNALRLAAVENVRSETEQTAAEHRARLERQTAQILRGPDYLCASLKEPETLSCQFISPFGGNLALVVYCDTSLCRMPALALNEKLIASATWRPSSASSADHARARIEIAEKIGQIHGFLQPLSSWKPDFKRFDQ